LATLNNGQPHCTVWHADRCSDLLLPLEMHWYIPTAGGQGGASSKWAQWWGAADKTAEGLIEPTEIKKYYDSFAKMTLWTRTAWLDRRSSMAWRKIRWQLDDPEWPRIDLQ
jgi:hypothetical protein